MFFHEHLIWGRLIMWWETCIAFKWNTPGSTIYQFVILISGIFVLIMNKYVTYNIEGDLDFVLLFYLLYCDTAMMFHKSLFWGCLLTDLELCYGPNPCFWCTLKLGPSWTDAILIHSARLLLIWWNLHEPFTGRWPCWFYLCSDLQLFCTNVFFCSFC